MRSFVCKIGLVILAAPAYLLAVPTPPAGQPILNSPIYQRNSQAWVDTFTVQGILQLPYGSATPPSNQCTVSSQTGRMFIVSSTTAGGARIWVCEGVNGWQVKNSTGSGGSGNPGGTNTQFQYNNSGSFAGSANLTTDGSTITATRFSASTVTVSNQATFLSVSSTTWNNVSTMTFNDGVLLDMSGINDSNNGEGILIPQATDCSNATRNGSLCWDTDDKILYVGNGSGITNAMSIGLSVLNGAVIVSSPTKTLNFNSSQFSVAAPVSSTASVTLNASSVTLKGNSFFPVLQVQYYHTETSSNTTSTSFINTKLSGSFTPKSSTSKVILFASGNLTQNVGDGGYVTFARNGTNLAPNTGGFMGTVSGNNYSLSMVYSDAPGTTSTVTYSVQFRTAGGGATIVYPVINGAVVPSASMMAVEIAQ